MTEEAAELLDFELSTKGILPRASRVLRELRKWSQEELARQVGVSLQTIFRLEDGLSVSWRVVLLISAAGGFVRVEDFLRLGRADELAKTV